MLADKHDFYVHVLFLSIPHFALPVKQPRGEWVNFADMLHYAHVVSTHYPNSLGSAGRFSLGVDPAPSLRERPHCPSLSAAGMLEPTFQGGTKNEFLAIGSAAALARSRRRLHGQARLSGSRNLR